MNKTFFMLVLLFSTVFTGIQAQKIAYINSNTLMADVPEIKSADSNLQAFQSQLQKKGEQMVAVLQGKYQDLAKRQQSDFEQDMNKQIADKRQALYQPILDRLNMLINDVAKEKGYNFVFDSSTGVILYADEMYDLTQAVKEKMKATNMTEAKPASTTPKTGGK